MILEAGILGGVALVAVASGKKSTTAPVGGNPNVPPAAGQLPAPTKYKCAKADAFFYEQILPLAEAYTKDVGSTPAEGDSEAKARAKREGAAALKGAAKRITLKVWEDLSCKEKGVMLAAPVNTWPVVYQGILANRLIPGSAVQSVVNSVVNPLKKIKSPF